MFSRGETRVSLAPSLFLCSSERENREARNECKRWSVGRSVARTDSAYNLRLASTFLFSWKITERRCAGKIDTLRPLFAADNKNGKKNLSFSFTVENAVPFPPPPPSLSFSLSLVGRFANVPPPPLGTRPPGGARAESSKCHRLFPEQA